MSIIKHVTYKKLLLMTFGTTLVHGELVECCWQGITEILGEEPFAVTFCPPQTFLELVWDRIQPSTVIGRKVGVFVCMS